MVIVRAELRKVRDRDRSERHEVVASKERLRGRLIARPEERKVRTRHETLRRTASGVLLVGGTNGDRETQRSTGTVTKNDTLADHAHTRVAAAARNVASNRRHTIRVCRCGRVNRTATAAENDQVVTADQPEVRGRDTGNRSIRVVVDGDTDGETGTAERIAVTLRTDEMHAGSRAGRGVTRIDDTAINGVDARDLPTKQRSRDKRKDRKLSFQHSYTSKKWLWNLPYMRKPASGVLLCHGLPPSTVGKTTPYSTGKNSTTDRNPVSTRIFWDMGPEEAPRSPMYAQYRPRGGRGGMGAGPSHFHIVG